MENTLTRAEWKAKGLQALDEGNLNLAAFCAARAEELRDPAEKAELARLKRDADDRFSADACGKFRTRGTRSSLR